MLVGYSRVSLGGGRQDHALQLDALQAAGCERIFVEDAGGARADRPELRKAIEFCRPNDVLVTYALSRLSRDLRHTLEIVEELGRREIHLRSLTEAIDTTTPAGRMLLSFCGIMAQAEREYLRQRTRDGLAAARARGRRGGRPRSLDETKIKIARALAADGQLSMAEIAAQLGCAPSTLYRSLPGGRSQLGTA